MLLRIAAVIALLLLPVSTHAALRLGSLFKNHMVLQAGVKAPVWGWASPGTKVTVLVAGREAKCKADASGRWMAHVKPIESGGPYTLTVIAGTDTAVVRDVLVGEVWLCSGQSNMQWPVQESGNSVTEIADARWPQVRMFSVERTFAADPVDTCKGTWQQATPEHIAYFSAVGYFFGRELYKNLNVPIGLIHTSWGGTPAESWTTRKTLESHPELLPMFANAQKTRERQKTARASYDSIRCAWEQSISVLRDSSGKLPERQIDIGNAGADSGWMKPGLDESTWNTMALPQLWEKSGIDIDGAVWFRKTIDIPSSWAGKELQVSLGVIDDMDVTYWNGFKIGATGKETPDFWAVRRTYSIPASQVTAGKAVIAVRVFDHWGGGGFGGQSGEMTLSVVGASEPPIPLAGDWKYRIERELPPLMPPAAPLGYQPQNEPAVLYNAMIHPVAPYACRGAIWYQGESNAARAEQYRILLPSMIADWRNAFGNKNLLFGIVQLANFMERQLQPGPSEWAELREAQLMTAIGDEFAGLAVAIDIGETNDIHPKNKQDVGSRLALWALAKGYGKDTVYSGPLYRSVAFSGDSAVLSFDHVGGGLVCKGDSLSAFAVAGPDSLFVWASARINGETVVVKAKSVVGPVAVRYGWADNPSCNLYNKAGLPASPFRTDTWPGETAGKR